MAPEPPALPPTPWRAEYLAVGSPPPNTITFFPDGGHPVTLYPDGRVDIPEGVTTDDAARSFWDAVRSMGMGQPCPQASPDPAGIPPRPWCLDPDADGRIWDAEGQPVAQAFARDGGRNKLACTVARAVNLCHPPPEAVQPPQTVLALAILSGDESAAWVAADDVLAHSRQPDGFVTRGELVAVLRKVVGSYHPEGPHYDMAPAESLLARLDGGTPVAPAGEL